MCADLDPLAVDRNNLMNKFEFVSVIFIRRILNVGAHNLVGLGRSLGSRIWLDFIPIV